MNWIDETAEIKREAWDYLRAGAIAWPLVYRPQCPVVVHASVNDELPARGEPRYA